MRTLSVSQCKRTVRSLIYDTLSISDWIVFWWVEPLNYLIRENGRVKVYLIINQNFLYIDAAITGIKGIQGFLCSAKDRETIDFRYDVLVNLKLCRARGRAFIPMLTKKTVVMLFDKCLWDCRYLLIVCVLKLQLVEYGINTGGYNMHNVKWLRPKAWTSSDVFYFDSLRRTEHFYICVIILHAWFTNRYGCLCRGYLKLIFL